MKRIVQSMSLMLALQLCLMSTIFATDRTVPITFSVTGTGINRFIAGQWNDAGFQKSWSGYHDVVSYSFTLNRPVISLSTGTIKIILSITITAYDEETQNIIYDNKSFIFTPTLTIPSTTISASNIIAQYTDLHNAIIAVIPDARVQQAVEQHLTPISWIMYKGKVLSESTARFTESADIGWKGLPMLTFAVANDEVNLTITPMVYSNAPSYSFQWMRSVNRDFGFRVYSNNQFTLDLTNNKLATSLGGQIGFAVTSTIPVQATYDATQQKYIAEITFRLNNLVANGLGSCYTNLKIKRGNMETLWTFNFLTYGDHAWTFSDTHVAAISGE